MIMMAIVGKHINLYKATSNRTEQAILCNTTNEWNEIGARYVYAQNTPNIYYGGSTGVSDNRELARTVTTIIVSTNTKPFLFIVPHLSIYKYGIISSKKFK